MFCPECETEYRDGFYECADCRVPLVLELPEPEPEPEFVPIEWVTVFEVGDPGAAAIAKSLLESAKVPYVAQDQHGASFYVGTMLIPVRIKVPKEQADLASDLLRDL